MNSLANELRSFAARLPATERAALESLATLLTNKDTTDVDAEALRGALFTAQGRAESSAGFQIRLRRLGEALQQQGAPFIIEAADGRVRVRRGGPAVSPRR